MALLGATLEVCEPGVVHIGLQCHERVMSHIPPAVHGGTVGMIADSAMGFAGLTLADVGEQGVTAEYKINFLAPAVGDQLIARGEVFKKGAKLTVATAEVVAVQPDGAEKKVAMSTATLIPL
ncbi:PaaI family thioesterase [Streptomyces sp. SB3404]|uniref:PaaI family thioesterase n=2 Tax=Streptomyces boncukensis TaxID=2711219 RepID=A0A6G4WPE0_9ACTN|nr:PaaI family thioesterase [Streptomyces boncukensis]